MNRIVKNNTIIVGEEEFRIGYQFFESACSDGSKRYGVSVRNEITGETSVIRDLTTDKESAKQFFEDLVQGGVTPLHLKDLAEDFVASFSL